MRLFARKGPQARKKKRTTVNTVERDSGQGSITETIYVYIIQMLVDWWTIHVIVIRAAEITQIHHLWRITNVVRLAQKGNVVPRHLLFRRQHLTRHKDILIHLWHCRFMLSSTFLWVEYYFVSLHALAFKTCWKDFTILLNGFVRRHYVSGDKCVSYSNQSGHCGTFIYSRQ